MTRRALQHQTIQDFGEQWTRYQDNDGYYGSAALFRDVFGPLLDQGAIAGCRVADMGAGTGRFTNVLLAAGARHVLAVEPSDAFAVLQNNTVRFRDQITYLNAPGDGLPPSGDLDYVFSIGVIHHIPEPKPVVEAAIRALRPGGKCAIWLYGREGNGAYVGLARAVRTVTRWLPHSALAALVWLLYWPVAAYMLACRHLPLPLAGYMRSVFARLTPDKRRLVLYDQLNPAYAKYYTRDEARDVLVRAGFTDVRLHHRHGYSWSVIGTKS
jgi:SAM-dependent methyltransferase